MPGSKHARGFTLVEILISLFVLMFGLIGILALFPAGLDAMRDAADESMSAMIAQSASAMLLYEAANGNRFPGGTYPEKGDMLLENNPDYGWWAVGLDQAYSPKLPDLRRVTIHVEHPPLIHALAPDDLGLIRPWQQFLGKRPVVFHTLIAVRDP